MVRVFEKDAVNLLQELKMYQITSSAVRDSGARLAEELKKFGGDTDVPVIRAIQEYGRSFAEIESSREKMNHSISQLSTLLRGYHASHSKSAQTIASNIKTQNKELEGKMAKQVAKSKKKGKGADEALKVLDEMMSSTEKTRKGLLDKVEAEQEKLLMEWFKVFCKMFASQTSFEDESRHALSVCLPLFSSIDSRFKDWDLSNTKKNHLSTQSSRNLRRALTSVYSNRSLKLDEMVLSAQEEQTSEENAGETVVVLHAYHAQRPDEIDLRVGDSFVVSKKHEDGWWVGVNQEGKKGVFPSNFVIDVKELHQKEAEKQQQQP